MRSSFFTQALELASVDTAAFTKCVVDFKEYLVIADYRAKTQAQYITELCKFTIWYTRIPTELTQESIRGYLYHYIETYHPASKSYKVIVCALQKYMESINLAFSSRAIPRVKSNSSLPLYFGSSAIIRLLSALNNDREKRMISLMIIQWVWNAPRLAFYLNLIPVGICVALIANAVKLDIDISAFTGIGFYITFIAGIISVLAAWTTIGLHYYCSYKRYMKILTYCILISIGISFVSAILILSDKLFESKAGMILSTILMFLSGILGAISFLHFPFVVYAWIIVLFTKDSQKKVLSTVNEAVEMVEPEQERTVEPNRFCPQCQKTMEPDWNTCPYCGHNPEDAEKKRQEEDDLRFAPPQCQNNR